MDGDWDLIVALATLLVAASAVVLILIEAGARRRAQSLPIDPRPRWRAAGPPTAGVLPIEVSNTGATAASCCVVMHAGEFLCAGNFSLAEQQSWAPQSLEVFDTVDRTTGANSLFCVARNLDGLWWAVAPQRVISAMPDSAVPFEVCRLLRRATDRTCTCGLEADGKLVITPISPSARPSVETVS